MPRQALWILGWLFLAPASWAHTEQILSLSVTNATGYLLAGDATLRGSEYNRENIAARAEVDFATTNALTALTYSYLIEFELLDSVGRTTEILDADGQTNTVYRLADSVTLPGGVPPFAVLRQVTRVYDAPLVPANRLDPLEAYRVHLRLRKRGSGDPKYVVLPASATDVARTYYHFPNARSGDAALNVIALLDRASYARTYLVKTIPGRDAFRVQADFTLRRYDDFASAPAASDVPLRFTYELQDAETGAAIPLVRSHQLASRSLLSHGFSIFGSPIPPATLSSSETLELTPANPIDSVGRLYRAVVRLEHTDVQGQPAAPANQVPLPSQQFLSFNGRLLFGTIETLIRGIANEPTPTSVFPVGINTVLTVIADGGVIVGHPEHRYGNGTPLPVVLRSSGDAEYLGQADVPVHAPTPDTSTVANVRLQRAGLALRNTGAYADLVVWLPSGFGYRFNQDSRILQGTLAFNNRRLGQELAPDDGPRLTAPLIYVCEETKPLWFEGTELAWDVPAGRFVFKPTGAVTYVRRPELARLRAAPIPAADQEKRSNELVFETVDRLTSPELVVHAHSDGSARLDFEADLKPGAFRAHFPYDTRVEFAEGGHLSVVDDQVVTARSGVTGVESVAVNYRQGCSEPGCGAVPDPVSVVLAPKGHDLLFTSDGGLAAGGEIHDPQELAWGWIDTPSLHQFAQRVRSFPEGRFHMPGSFLRGDATALVALHRPGVLLHSGVAPDDPGLPERFGEPAYDTGLGDYAGLNYRLARDGDQVARSVLGGHPTEAYPLTARSKYYVRPGGVSGIHEAVFGAAPGDAKIYGYDFQFSNYGLSYLDSLNQESRTSGSIGVGGPSHFTLNFEELKFSCLGALEPAKVPEGEGDKVLEYWRADFKPLAIQFDRPEDLSCDPTKGYLTVGVEAWAQHVEAVLFGRLGWHANGNLITLDDHALDPPFDSRLKLPNAFPIVGPVKGPGHETYDFTPVNDAYYNNWEFAKADQGFLNIAGKLDVPFFEDLRVHLHTSADRDNDVAPLYLMGGWPDRGFDVNGLSFFTANPADPDNLGVPGDTTVAGYRTGNTDGHQKYLVRAQRHWLGFIDLDYPLTWNDTGRAFTAFDSVADDLLVLHVQHQAKYLSPEHAELVFGAQYPGLPQLNLANLAFAQLGGLETAFSGPVLQPARAALETGVHGLDELLSDQLKEFFDPTFDTLFDPIIESLYQALKTDYLTHGNAFSGGSPAPIIASRISGGGNSIANRLRNLLDGAATPEQVDVIKHLASNLAQVEDALAQTEILLARDPAGQRRIIGQLIQNIAGKLAAQFAGAFTDATLNETLTSIDPSLTQIQAALAELRTTVGEIRGQLAPGQEFRTELQSRLNALAGTVMDVASQHQSDVNAIFAEIAAQGDNPFTAYTAEELRARIRQKLEDRFFASPLASSIHESIKQRLYDVDAAIRQGLDSVFQQINLVLREVITQSLASVDQTITPFLDDCRQVMGAGQINGYAHITDDALRLLRLDLKAQFKVPTELEFNGFLEIKELTSDGTASECLPKSGRANEVTLGANDVAVTWMSEGVRATANAKFTFDPANDVPTLVNLSGGLDLRGDLRLELFRLEHLGAWMGFGLLENYFSAAAQVSIGDYQGSGGLYFGRTCSLAPLGWDPDVQSLLGSPPFTGAYGYVDVWLPISEALLGVPASCFFDVSAGVGAGAGFFLEGPTFVGKMLLEAEGEVLCLATLSGEIKLVGLKNPDGLHLKGSGRLSAELGHCPFCITLSHQVGLEYKHGSWDVDL